MKKAFTIFLSVIMMVTIFPLSWGDYAFAASTTYESEPNNEIWQANTWDIYNSDTFKGSNLQFREEGEEGEDYIKVNLKESSKVRFIAKNTGSGGIHVAIYNDVDIMNMYSRSLVSTTYREGIGYCYGEETVYLSKGIYYLKVSASNYIDEYELHTEIEVVKDDFDEPNDYIESASTIVQGIEYNGVLSYPAMVPNKHYDEYDQDAIKITAPENGKYYVNFSYTDPDEGDVTLDEYNRSGERIHKIKGNVKRRGKRYGFTELVTLKKGTHYYIASVYTRPYRTYHGCQYSISISPKISKVSKLKASKLGGGKIRLSWNAKGDVDGYRIYRLNPNTGKYAYIGKSKTTSFVDNKARRGITNSYKVKAYKMRNGSREDGYFSDAVKRKA